MARIVAIPCSASPGHETSAQAAVIQKDRGVIIAGYSIPVGGSPCLSYPSRLLSRFSSSGAPDPTFAPKSVGGIAEDLALQADGKLVVARSISTGCTSVPLLFSSIVVERILPGNAEELVTTPRLKPLRPPGTGLSNLRR